MVNFHNPYLFDTPISFGLSGSYFTRIYQNWTEKRLGGPRQPGLSVPLRPNLSTVVSFRGENVNISNPTVPTPPELEQVLGNNAFFSGRGTSSTTPATARSWPPRATASTSAWNRPSAATLFRAPRSTLSQHFLLHERPDTSGRHTLSLSNQTGLYRLPTRRSMKTSLPAVTPPCAASTSAVLRRWTRACRSVVTSSSSTRWNTCSRSPATTCLRGVAFTDFGTVEPSTELQWQDFRISPGLGLRVTVPAMGPAPIALDFAVPIHHAPGDQLQLFSFFIGVNR